MNRYWFKEFPIYVCTSPGRPFEMALWTICCPKLRVILNFYQLMMIKQCVHNIILFTTFKSTYLEKILLICNNWNFIYGNILISFLAFLWQLFWKWPRRGNESTFFLVNMSDSYFGYHYVAENIVWWHHQMETFSVFLALCEGNSPVTGEFPSQRPVMRSFKVFSDLRLNKRLSKQPRGWWFETPSRSL